MKELLTLWMCLVSAIYADAQFLLGEDFDFSGNVSGVNGWVTSSGTTNLMQTTVPGLSFQNYIGSGVGNAVAVNGVVGEDVFKTFTAQRKLYYSFMVKVVQNNTSVKTDYVSFFGKTQGAGVGGGLNGNYFARIAIQTLGDGTWNIGTSNWSLGNATYRPVYSTTIFQNSQTYAVVVALDMDDNYKIQIWVKESDFPVNAVDAGSPDVVFSGAPNTAALPTSVDAIGLRQSTSSPSVVMDGLRVFTTWDAQVLPLKLLSIKGWSDNNKNVQLEWVAAHAVNVSHFEIEKSTDAKKFQYSASVPCINQASNRTYHHTDYNAYSSPIFYRLKIVDLDGKYDYSSVVRVFSQNATTIKIGMLGGKTIRVFHPQTLKSGMIKVLDFNGTVRKLVPVTVGVTMTQLHLSELPSATYILIMEQDGKSGSEKFFLQ
ncbi:MAG: hypothetical protein QM610_08755 [Chitinophagaceae bacterium]